MFHVLRFTYCPSQKMQSIDQIRKQLAGLKTDDPAFEEKAARLRHDLNAHAALMVQDYENARQRMKLMGKAQVLAAMDAFLEAVEKA
jgi:hypothetical protein